jgi:heme/copper-type cytochrome/quinol oxidase subunit 3
MVVKNKTKTENMEKWIRLSILLFVITLIVLFIFFLKQYIILKKADIINIRETEISSLIKSHNKFSAQDADIIRSWMTFDYINKLFNIPQSYLQTTLNITSSHYPKLVVSDYIEDNRLDKNIFLQSLISAVKGYINQH